MVLLEDIEGRIEIGRKNSKQTKRKFEVLTI
jgi:hypothetical protein